MILSLISALSVGVIGGVGADELLRGRDPRSSRVIVAGVVGAIAGLIVHRASGGGGTLLSVLAALLGACLTAFATRVRVSAAIARAA
jgi:uncharacterized membrane protein YeaQ/YmgE (transglycosylase-associated protein family)